MSEEQLREYIQQRVSGISSAALDDIMAQLQQYISWVIGVDEPLYQPGDTSVDEHMREMRNLVREEQRTKANIGAE